MKHVLAERVNPVAYANWIEPTCQVGRDGTTVLVWLPDELTRDWLDNEYAAQIEEALANIGRLAVEYTYCLSKTRN